MKKGWQTKTLGEICEIERGGSPRPIQNFITTDPNGINWIKIGDATASEKYIYKTEEKIRPEGVKRSRMVYKGDFILSNSMSFGRPYIMKTTGCIHDGWLVLHQPKVDPDYLYYVLSSNLVFNQFDQLAAGSTVRNLNIGLAKSVEIPYPPLPEQQRIVGILDEAFEGIATAKANAEKNLHNARALFESYFDSAVTGKLTQEWRRKHGNTENASAGLAVRLAERRKQWTGTGKYREPDSPIVLKPIDIPKGWVLASPEQITTHIVDCPHSTPKWAESGVLCLRTTNFKPGFLDLESVRFVSQQTYKERIMRLEPKPGDVLYSREGGILGVACMIPEQLKTCLGQRMMLFRTDPALVLPEYFTAVLNSTLVLSEVIRLTSGAASPHLNICDIRTFPIPLPPITEQRQIVSKLDAITTETQRLESIYQHKLAALDELKKSLLHQAFNGEL